MRTCILYKLPQLDSSIQESSRITMERKGVHLRTSGGAGCLFDLGG